MLEFLNQARAHSRLWVHAWFPEIVLQKVCVCVCVFRYKYGRKLGGDRTVKPRLLLDMITESQFADGATLYATSEQNFQTVAQSFVSVASSWGLTVSLLKTKGMTISNESSFVDGVPVCDQSVEMVKEFPYLGSAITSDGEIDADVNTRIAKAANVFGCLKRAIYTNQELPLDVKRAVYKAVVLATLLYGSECWAVKAYHIQQLEVFYHRSVKCMLGVTRINSGLNI